MFSQESFPSSFPSSNEDFIVDAGQRSEESRAVTSYDRRTLTCHKRHLRGTVNLRLSEHVPMCVSITNLVLRRGCTTIKTELGFDLKYFPEEREFMDNLTMPLTGVSFVDPFTPTAIFSTTSLCVTRTRCTGGNLEDRLQSRLRSTPSSCGRSSQTLLDETFYT